MKRQQGIYYVVLAGILSGVSGIALAIDEVEFNHPIPSAQLLTFTSDATGGKGSATVSGVIGKPASADAAELDVDFYKFYAREGDVVTIDIDGGIKSSGGERSVDTILTLFGPGPAYPVLIWNDDVPMWQPIDAGSISRLDARLDNVRLQTSGIYTVGVSGYPARLNDGGAYADTRLLTNSNGAYTLIISGVSPNVQQINIEIKPGSGTHAPINPKAKGTIPVALLSSAEFNAMNVDVKSLTFGATGGEASFSRCGKDGEDINGDGRLDRVCHFENQLAGFDLDDSTGIVKGRTNGGTMFEGRGMLKVVPVKREYD